MFNILTNFVAAIAAISLLVGGIGIMNIMLASVSERTREIGVRKAVGATNNQILSQFLIEATVISVFGGILGVLLSLLANFIIRLTTSIHPSFITFYNSDCHGCSNVGWRYFWYGPSHPSCPQRPHRSPPLRINYFISSCLNFSIKSTGVGFKPFKIAV